MKANKTKAAIEAAIANAKRIFIEESERVGYVTGGGLPRIMIVLGDEDNHVFKCVAVLVQFGSWIRPGCSMLAEHSTRILDATTTRVDPFAIWGVDGWSRLSGGHITFALAEAEKAVAGAGYKAEIVR